jgi:hypothetical protein
MSDVDLLHKQIHMFLIRSLNDKNNYKLYGVGSNLLNLGGGCCLFIKDKIINMNGYSNKYIGWGSEDMDLTYRIHFNSCKIFINYMINRHNNNNFIIEENRNDVSENKLMHDKINNNTFVQQIINYNLIFYYENKNKFKHLIKEKNIYFENILFFEGEYTIDKLKYGKLYDLVSSNNNYPTHFVKDKCVLIYEGDFINGLPSGLGKGYNIISRIKNNTDLIGYWKNGYIKKDENDIKLIEIENKCDFELYKKNVYTGYNEIDITFTEIENKVKIKYFK